MAFALSLPVPALPASHTLRPRHQSQCPQRLLLSCMKATSLSPVPIPAIFSSVRVLGLGACGMDLIAAVPHFPAPDEKLRTTSTLFSGGGNVANSLTALRRLGVSTTLVAKIGDDAHGGAVLEELRGDGVDVRRVVVKEGMRTPFTYVIVDTERGTRACLHTPAEEDVVASELELGNDDDFLEGVSLVMLDCRHTLAAITLARAANKRGVPVLLDIERDRPFVGTLLQYCDYIVTSSEYPLIAYPGAQGRVDAMSRLLLKSGRARVVITTTGSSGSLVVRRDVDDRRDRGARDSVLHVTRERMAADAVGRFRAGVSERGGGRDRGEAMPEQEEIVVMQCPAWPAEKVVDTTGAGDAFVAGIAYGIIAGLSLEQGLGLAARVAARKIGMIGARDGLPRREEMDKELLTALPKY